MPTTIPTIVRAVFFAAAVLLRGTAAEAADQGLVGKKLLIKNPPSGAAGNKVVHLAKDLTIQVYSAGSAGDPQAPPPAAVARAASRSSRPGAPATSPSHSRAPDGRRTRTIPFTSTGTRREPPAASSS